MLTNIDFIVRNLFNSDFNWFSSLSGRPSDDEDDRLSNGKMSVQSKIFTDADQSDQENGDEGWKIFFLNWKKIFSLIFLVDEANENGALPLILKTIIERKATKNNNAKSYLLEISKYAGLCDFLLDRSRTSFDHRPTDDILRPFLVTQFGPNVAKDTKLRVRIRDELREIHRSYLRTFMHDPHGLNKSATKSKKNANLSMKKSPLWTLIRVGRSFFLTKCQLFFFLRCAGFSRFFSLWLCTDHAWISTNELNCWKSRDLMNRTLSVLAVKEKKRFHFRLKWANIDTTCFLY